MTFELNTGIGILGRTPSILDTLLSDLPDDWTMNNEGKDTWSPYDVLGHLIHGEKTDWIPRIKIILSSSLDKTFESFDRFAQLKTTQKNSLQELLSEFRMLRDKNMQELSSLAISESQLSETGRHPDLGTVELRELLSTWVVHDLGHIAQISRVMAKQYESEVGPWIKYLGILHQQ